MANDRNIAMAKLGGMKTTLVNAIAELEIRAAEASKKGDDKRSSALSLKAGALARQAATIRRAEDEIRAQSSLKEAIDKLDKIAADARGTVKRLKATEKALDEAGKLLNIIAQLASIFL